MFLKTLPNKCTVVQTVIGNSFVQSSNSEKTFIFHKVLQNSTFKFLVETKPVEY